jgi:hypothetical protein
LTKIITRGIADTHPRNHFPVHSQRGFLNPQKRAPPRDQRNFIRRFWDEQIVSPDKVDGNVTIAWAALVFAGGIVAARTIAKDIIVPAL